MAKTDAKKKAKKKAKKTRAKSAARRRRRAAGITRAQYSNLLIGIRSLHERLDLFMSGRSELRPPAVSGAPAAEAASADGMVSLKFKKTTGPDNVRVTLMDTNEPVLLEFSKEGASRPRAVGATCPAKVEVNAGATVVIDVTHASPSQLDGRGEFPITVLE